MRWSCITASHRVACVSRSTAPVAICGLTSRSPTPPTHLGAVAALAQLAEAERAKGAGASVTVTRVHGGESLTSIPARASFELDVRTLNATRWHDIEPQFASASTDANVPLSRGIPAISIGGGGGGAHTLDERYEDAHDARGLSRALAIIAAAAHGALSPF